jgi:Holliday junction resolvase
MTNYSNGVTFERTIMRTLADDGYWVTRSAGSHSCVDVVAIKAGQLLLIQAKRDGKISPAERASLLNLAALIDCAVPVLAYKEPGHAAVILAELTGPGPKDRRPFHTDEVTAA